VCVGGGTAAGSIPSWTAADESSTATTAAAAAAGHDTVTGQLVAGVLKDMVSDACDGGGVGGG
jgi:hypothetical protein